jgi:N,N'-diacetylchitobiose transport system permease protein
VAAVAAGTAPGSRRRRRRSTWSRFAHSSAPYLLIAPVAIVTGAILGYPIYKLFTLSLQRYGLEELIARKGVYVGFDNFSSVLHDPIFWHTLARTIVFTAANVGLTMGIGIALALLLLQLSRSVRLILTAGLVLVWSMPVVVAVQVWYWMTNFHNGVLNHFLTQAHVGDFFQHDWYATSFSQLAMTTSLIVWAGIPFVVIAVYAGLAQVPGELLEAAAIDGARPWRILWDVTFPIVKPVLLILTSLSIIWDYAVFTQPFLLIGRSHLDASNMVMGVYLYVEAYANSDFGRGAAISLLMLLTVAAMSVFYIRQMIRIGEVK